MNDLEASVMLVSCHNTSTTECLYVDGRRGRMNSKKGINSRLLPIPVDMTTKRVLTKGNNSLQSVIGTILMECLFHNGSPTPMLMRKENGCKSTTTRKVSRSNKKVGSLIKLSRTGNVKEADIIGTSKGSPSISSPACLMLRIGTGPLATCRIPLLWTHGQERMRPRDHY